MNFITVFQNIFRDVYRRGSLRGNLFAPLTLCALLLPGTAFAAITGGVLGFLDGIIMLVTAIVPILIGCAIIVFFWGIVKFIAHTDDEKAVAEGKQIMIWGMIGIFVIVALWSIVGYVQQSLGLDLSLPAGTAPSVPSTPTVVR